MPEQSNTLPSPLAYTPVEMLKMFQNYLVRKNPNNIVWMRGIYLQKPNQVPAVDICLR